MTTQAAHPESNFFVNPSTTALAGIYATRPPILARPTANPGLSIKKEFVDDTTRFATQTSIAPMLRHFAQDKLRTLSRTRQAPSSSQVTPRRSASTRQETSRTSDYGHLEDRKSADWGSKHVVGNGRKPSARLTAS